MDTGYVWDEDKYNRTRKKHGIVFGEVVDACENKSAIHTADPGDNLNRRMAVGGTRSGRVLQVIYTDEDAPLIRIITAFDASERWENEYLGR